MGAYTFQSQEGQGPVLLRRSCCAHLQANAIQRPAWLGSYGVPGRAV